MYSFKVKDKGKQERKLIICLSSLQSICYMIEKSVSLFKKKQCKVNTYALWLDV